MSTCLRKRAEASPVDPISTLPQIPRGALRILARRNDSQILILHGEDRVVAEDERVAHIEWLPSIEVAWQMSHSCSTLLIVANFKPDAEGWHNYDVRNLKALTNVAKNHLNITEVPTQAPAERQAWTGERIARLATMATDGYTAKAIADDPQIRSTPTAVYKAAQRFGILLSERPRGQINIRLPLDDLAFYDRNAERLHLTRDAYIRRVLIAHAEDRVLEPL